MSKVLVQDVIVTGGFDDIRCRDVRFLEEAARYGRLRVLLYADESIRILTGKAPIFSQAERAYFLESVRYVDSVTIVEGQSFENLSARVASHNPQVWVVTEAGDTPEKRQFCASKEINYVEVPERDLRRLPEAGVDADVTNRAAKRVLVTGCFDWFHSGHVRFFEETSELGDLYVVLGHDENVRLLKGEGHPQFGQEERRYIVQAIRFVKQALISTGHGWLDAEPEIAQIKPDIYAVNEDGDKAEKRAFCAEHGIDYVVLHRRPKEGLPQRTSTALRGF